MPQQPRRLGPQAGRTYQKAPKSEGMTENMLIQLYQSNSGISATRSIKINQILWLSNYYEKLKNIFF
jgi:hypothetical protein